MVLGSSQIVASVKKLEDHLLHLSHMTMHTSSTDGMAILIGQELEA